MAEDIEGNLRFTIDASQALATLRNLQSQIAQFHNEMARGGAAANQQAAQLQQNLINNINSGGKFAASITNVSSATESFTTALEKNKFTLGQYFKYAVASSQQQGRFFKSEFEDIQRVAESRVRTLRTQFINLGRDASGAMKAIQVRPLTLDLQDMATKTAIAAQKQQILNKIIDQGSTNMLNWGKNTQWAGRQLMVGFTIPLTMMATTSARAFMELEKQIIAFKRVYGDFTTTKEQTDAMAESVRNLAKEYTKYGVATADTMGLAAKAAAMGKQGADLLAQVSETTRLAVLGNVDQQQALDTTISLTNAFGTAADELAGKIDFLNAVENQTVTSIEDLTIAIPKAGPVIKQLGGNVEDLTFLLTAMREGGINASEGANALKSGLAALINPTKVASDMLMGYGINIKKMVNQDKGDAKKLIIDFASALDQLDPLSRSRAIEQMFGKFQFARISTLFQNVIKEGSQAQEVLKLTNASSQELAILSQRELSKVSESTTYKFQKAVTDFQTALAPIGEQFLKLVTPIIEFGTKLLNQFNSMGEGAKQFAITLTVGLGVVGPALLMIAGLFANALANIIKFAHFITSAFGKTSKGSQDVALQTEYMTQAQLQAQAVAASLYNTHNALANVYGIEAGALRNLTAAYESSIAAQNTTPIGQRIVAQRAARKFATGGVISGPGTGTSDSIPAMVSNGEAIIPAAQTKKYEPLIRGMIAGNLPGFSDGGIVDTYKIAPNKKITAQQMEEALRIIANPPRTYGEPNTVLYGARSVFSGIAEDLAMQRADVYRRQEIADVEKIIESGGLQSKFVSSQAGRGGFEHLDQTRLTVSKLIYGKASEGMPGSEIYGYIKAPTLPFDTSELTPIIGKVASELGIGSDELHRKVLDILESTNEGILKKPMVHGYGEVDLKFNKAAMMASNAQSVIGDTLSSSTDNLLEYDARMKAIRAMPVGKLLSGDYTPEERAAMFGPSSMPGFYEVAIPQSAAKISNIDEAILSGSIQNKQMIDSTTGRLIKYQDVQTPPDQVKKAGAAFGKAKIPFNTASYVDDAMLSLLKAYSPFGSKAGTDLSAFGKKKELPNYVDLQNNPITVESALKQFQQIQKGGSSWDKDSWIWKKIPHFANGIFNVPGPKGAGDVVPAMLSPGEAVIPAKMAMKYGGLINGMIADRIPGYEDGFGVVVKKPRVNRQSGVRTLQLPAGETFDQAHFSGYTTMTGQELINWAKTQNEETLSSVKKRLESERKILEESTGKAIDVLSESFQVYNNEVVNFSSGLNNLFGTSGTNTARTASKDQIMAEVSRVGVFAHGRFASDMANAGISPEESVATITRLQALIEENIAALGDGVQLSGDDFDKIVTQAYDEVAATSSEGVKQVREAMKTPTAILTKGKDNSRKRLGSTLPYNAAGQREAGIEAIQNLFPNASMPFGSVRKQFTVSGAEGTQSKFGSANAVVNAWATLKKYDQEEALRLGNLVASGQISKQQFFAQLEAALLKFNITLTDVITATKDMVIKSIPQELDAASRSQSPSQETRRSAQNMVDGVILGLEEGVPKVTTAAEKLASGTQTGGVRKSGRRASRSAGAPGTRYVIANRPRDEQLAPYLAGGNQQIIIPREMTDREPLVLAEGDRFAPGISPVPYGPEKPTMGQKIGAKFTGLKTKVVDWNARTGGMGGMMVAGSAGMGIGMIPGLEGLGMAISTVIPILMMLPPVIGSVIAGLTLVVGSIYALNVAQEEQRKKILELANATTMSIGGLQKMSEDLGTVSATEARKAEQDAELANVTQKQLSLGMQYVQQMSSGQELLANIKAQQKAGMSVETISQSVASNMANAVAQNVITQKQGEEIIAALGVLSGNTGIGNVAGQQFQAYTRDITKTSGLTAKDNLTALQSRTQEQLAEINALNGRERAGAARQARLLELGGISTQTINAYGQAVGGIDAINAAYKVKIKEAKTQKEINDLEEERITKLKEQKDIAEKTYQLIIEQKNKLGDKFDQGFLENIKNVYGETSDMYKTAQSINNDLKDSSFKTRLQVQLESQTLTPASIDALIARSKTDATFGSTYELLIKTSGETDAIDLVTKLMTSGIPEPQQNLIIAGTNSTSIVPGLGKPAEYSAKEAAQAIGDLQAGGANMEKVTSETIQRYVNSVKKLKAETKDGKITTTLITKTVGVKDAKNAFFYSDKFNKLPKSTKLKLMSEYEILYKGGVDHNSPAYKDWVAAGGKDGDDQAFIEFMMGQSAKAESNNSRNRNRNTSTTSGGGSTEQVDPLQKKLDKRNAALNIIALKEADINKKYEDRKKALEEISKINAQISQQQQDQLALADALSQGDIAAAARAAAQMRTNAAQRAQEAQATAMDEAQKKELDALTFGGNTRKGLEEIIAKLQMKLAKKEYRKLAGGGSVMSRYYAGGGTPSGTDIVPAMLTPGEFVVRKPAVTKFGVDNLKAINNGESISGAVYNYSVTVNANGVSSADELARKVVQQIKQIDSHKLRGNRY